MAFGSAFLSIPRKVTYTCLIGTIAMNKSATDLDFPFTRCESSHSAWSSDCDVIKLEKITLYMNTTNAIGIQIEKAEHLSEKLNVLLADYSMFYQNTRGFHWNSKGDKFFELHLKFEELYNDHIQWARKMCIAKSVKINAGNNDISSTIPSSISNLRKTRFFSLSK